MKAENLARKGCLQRDSVEREGYAGARSAEAREGKEQGGAGGLLESILDRDNLNRAYKQVRSNHGAPGVDGMTVEQALPWLREHKGELLQSIQEGKYIPSPVRRKVIPKADGGGERKLGIPTVVDRVIQQAIAQKLQNIWEAEFSPCSYGYRPKRSARQIGYRGRTPPMFPGWSSRCSAMGSRSTCRRPAWTRSKPRESTRKYFGRAPFFRGVRPLSCGGFLNRKVVHSGRGKLLVDTPEVRIGEKIYPVDNRKKTVTKVMGMVKDVKGSENLERMDEAAKLLLGASAYREIEAMELPWPAWERLFELLMAAVTGEDADEARFQEGEKAAAK